MSQELPGFLRHDLQKITNPKLGVVRKANLLLNCLCKANLAALLEVPIPERKKLSIRFNTFHHHW